MRHRTVGQRGQAMVEALLLLPVLILMLLAIAWLGRTRFTALTLLQASRTAAMSIARGARVEIRDVPGGGRLQVVADSDGDGDAWQDQWWAADARRVSATSQADISGGAGWSDVRLTRRIIVAAGAGSARDEGEAQRRIGAAMTPWSRAAVHSEALARVVVPAVDAVDAPWRRSSLSLDWLSSWADVAPADKRMNDERGRP